jgi:exosortase
MSWRRTAETDLERLMSRDTAPRTVESSIGPARDSLTIVDAIGAVALVASFVWAYWSTISELVGQWNTQPDYSHGFLVAPFAAYLLWARRDRFPGRASHIAWLGLIPIGLSIAMRVIASRYYLEAINGWSIAFWWAGVAWLLGGWKVFLWSAPAIAFLWFMVPIPFRAESWLSYPLQTAATNISVWVLQCLGQPAIAHGHTIVVNSHTLEVAQACSGLRIFVGITALAVGYVILVRDRWWERVLLLLSLVPVALAANAARIVTTAFLYQYASDATAQKFSHDFAGWAMIPLAAALFAGVLWYVRNLSHEVEQVDVGDLLRPKEPKET